MEIVIERKRSEMVEIGMAKGFTHPEVVTISQELDELIIQAQKGQNAYVEKKNTSFFLPGRKNTRRA